jgi:ATP-dependent DNA ligase
LPANVQLDGELVACGAAGRPDFQRFGARMLHGDQSVPLTYAVFDMPAVEGSRQPGSRT